MAKNMSLVKMTLAVSEVNDDIHVKCLGEGWVEFLTKLFNRITRKHRGIKNIRQIWCNNIGCIF